MEEIKNNRRSRKYQLTFNNPAKHGIDHETIKKKLVAWPNILYYCMCDEQGETYHTHLYLLFGNPIRFSSLRKTFPTAHIETAQGTSAENRAYIRKEGPKWENSEKETTNLKDTFEEWGTIPEEGQGKRTDLKKLYEMVKDGYSNVEILEQNADYILDLQRIDKARLEILTEKYKKECRPLKVYYVYGKTGTGKTRGILETHGYENVYRITNYQHPFDQSQGEQVFVFEEFRGDLTIGSMLNYLDIYPLQLPARYTNRQACYTTVYIVSNIPLTAQYPNIQKEQPETWKAFLRRIHKVRVYDAPGHFIEYDTNEYLNGFHPAVGDDIPFEDESA